MELWRAQAVDFVDSVASVVEGRAQRLDVCFPCGCVAQRAVASVVLSRGLMDSRSDAHCCVFVLAQQKHRDWPSPCWLSWSFLCVYFNPLLFSYASGKNGTLTWQKNAISNIWWYFRLSDAFHHVVAIRQQFTHYTPKYSFPIFFRYFITWTNSVFDVNVIIHTVES